MTDTQVLTPGLIRELNIAFGRNGWTTAMVKELTAGNRLDRIKRDIFPPAREVYPVTIGDGRSKTDVFEACKFERINGSADTRLDGQERVGFLKTRDMVTWSTAEKHIDFELISFEGEMSTSRVFAAFERKGVLRPEREDVFWFAEKYPELQRQGDIIFLHKPFPVDDEGITDWYSFRLTMSLFPRENRYLRTLDIRSEPLNWSIGDRFAVRRP